MCAYNIGCKVDAYEIVPKCNKNVKELEEIN